MLLADDERQRYSALYRAYNLQPSADGASAAPSRSQQMLALAQQQQQAPVAQFASEVDLQIALIPPTPTIIQPMQVRLTRRNQCSDIRNYLQQQQSAGASSVWMGYSAATQNTPLSAIGYASISAASSSAGPSGARLAQLSASALLLSAGLLIHVILTTTATTLAGGVPLLLRCTGN